MNATGTGAPLRIAIAAVPFSSNLGDGVIHDIMCSVLLDQYKAGSIATLDLAGRTRPAALDAAERTRRKRGLGIINGLPAFLRPWLVLCYATLMYFRRSRRQYADVLGSVDHVIIGGGHLFSDLDLNFPSKLFFLHTEINRFQVPFSIYAVGVADNWSPLARYLFRRILRSPLLTAVSTRDAGSQQIMARELRGAGSSLTVTTVWDPAVATALVYPRPPPLMQSGKRHIGVNVADIALLASAGDRDTGIADGQRFFIDLLNRLEAAGHRITLFTNGAEEDENFLDALINACDTHWPRAARPVTPQDLVRLIQTFDLVISHRLHANIICYSYAIPSIGLGWDKKLPAFFGMAGRSAYLVEAATADSRDLIERILTLLGAGDVTTPQDTASAAAAARQQLLDFAQHALHTRSSGHRPASVTTTP